MKWFEELPEQCPPKEAKNPNKEVYYRAVANPIEERDFFSNKKKFPTKDYSRNECIARAISIHSSIEDTQLLLKLPAQRGKMIAEIILNTTDGAVLHTPSDTFKSHHSWWRSIDFSISNCKIV